MAKYTDLQRDTFLDVAQDIGPKAAREQLGFPTERTASRWCSEAGVDYEKVASKVSAQIMRTIYNDKQQAQVLSQILVKVEESLDEGVTAVVPGADATVGPQIVGGLPPTPQDLFRLAGAASRAIEKLRLIQGRATAHIAHGGTVTHAHELTDDDRRLLEASKARNEQTMAELAKVQT